MLIPQWYEIVVIVLDDNDFDNEYDDVYVDNVDDDP
jgi:hypothetical protein